MAYNSIERQNKLSEIIHKYLDFKDIKSLILLYAYRSETENPALVRLLSQLEDLKETIREFENYETSEIEKADEA